MPGANEYPPPKINELLRQAEVPADALRPSYEDMAGMARQLGTMIVEACEPKLPIDVYDLMVVLPRGGFFANDVLTHAFGFTGDRLQMVGVSSYEEDGRTPAEELRFTQLPDPEPFYGARVLVAEDVCDKGRTLQMTKDLLLGETSIPERIVQNSAGLHRRIPAIRYAAAQVDTAVIYHKPKFSKFTPDFYVQETDKWVVFPGEVYEQLGLRALKNSLWRQRS